MPSSVLPLGQKPANYFHNPREDLVARLPRPLGRVLDVGCGAGGVGRSLRNAGAQELIGIELDEDAASEARAVFDSVITGTVERALAKLTGSFDTICCYDILEHLFDPAEVVEGLLTVAGSGAHLHVSIPNARFLLLIRDLVQRGTFGYQPAGHRDATHVRWFTRPDIERLLSDCGWLHVDTSSHALKPGRAALTTLTRGYAREFFAVQWYVLCRAP